MRNRNVVMALLLVVGLVTSGSSHANPLARRSTYLDMIMDKNNSYHQCTPKVCGGVCCTFDECGGQFACLMNGCGDEADQLGSFCMSASH